MTIPDGGVVTVPYCGACGWAPFGEPVAPADDLNDDLVCDACGADLLAYGWTAGILAPTGVSLLEDDPTVWGSVIVTFTANAGADSTDMRYRFNSNPVWVLVTGVSTLDTIDDVPAGALVDVQLRSVDAGVTGPWGSTTSITVATYATGATAGIAGVWTGGGERPSDDVAQMITLDILADPLTTWTIGQSVVTTDTNDAHWNGGGWIIGTAP
jgi:hypothetical protein